MADEKLTRIESLKRQMYSRNTEGMRSTREHGLRGTESNVQTDWEHSELPQGQARTRSTALRFFLIFSIAFFLAALGYGGYLYFGGGNIVSSQNIGVKIEGPLSIRGGDTLPMDITIENRNATPLEVADLLVEFPAGTRDPKDLSRELPRFRVSLGDINPGESVKKKVSASIFGEERQTKDIKVTIEYRVPGSNAIFYKESTYQVVVNSAPISVAVDIPTEANSGQEFGLQVTLKSNSPEVMKGILLSAEYPSGFSYKSAEPKPFSQDRIWNIGDMQPGSSRTITVRGVLSGENLDARVFRFNVGIVDPKNPKSIGTPIASASEQISINKPFLGLSLSIQNSSQETVAVKSGQSAKISLTYTNNLLVPVADVELTLSLSGDALDKTSVNAGDGFYRSLDNVILWNKTTLPGLSRIAPGETGTLTLSLASKDLNEGIATMRNPQIQITADASGKRVESGKVPEQLRSTAKRTIKIESDVALDSKLIYYAAPIKNSGSIPPRAEKETTYNVIWTITNGANDLTDAVVKAELPTYVRFVKAQDGEAVSYSDIGKVVTWNVGAVKAGVGYGQPPRQAVFQIVFLPSVSQVGSSPDLLNKAVLSAFDRFTNTSITAEAIKLSTRLFLDPGSKPGDHSVVE